MTAPKEWFNFLKTNPNTDSLANPKGLERILGDGSLIVTIDDSPTIPQLDEWEATRTPHVGNKGSAHMTTMFFKQILHLLIDTTNTDKDKNFKTGVIIKDGVQIPIPNVDPNKMTYAQPELVDIHMQPLRSMDIPALVITETEFFNNELAHHREAVLEILNAVGEKSVELGVWKRYDPGTGILEERKVGSWQQIMSEGFALFEKNDKIQSESGRGGWVVPNEVRIVLLSVTESLIRKTNETHQISGPDMFTYINMHLETVNTLYEAAKVRFGDKIASKFYFRIYPMSDVRMVVPVEDKAQFDELLDLCARDPEAKSARAKEMLELSGKLKLGEITKEQLLEAQKRYGMFDKKKEGEAAQLIKHLNLIYDVKQPDAVWHSQHPMDPNRPFTEQLYLPELAYDLTIGQMSSLKILWETIVANQNKKAKKK